MTCNWSSTIQTCFSGSYGLILILCGPRPQVMSNRFVILRPRIDHVAVAIDHEDDVVIAPLPPAFRGRLTGCAQSVVVPRRVADRGVEHGVGRPRIVAFRQREFAALGDPDTIGRLGIHRAHRTPGPALVGYAVRFIR